MDLRRIITQSGLRFDYLAEKLFPNNRHPYNALNRVVTRGGELTGTQLKALAEVTGLSVDTILGTAAAKGRLTKNSLTFHVDGFDVVFDPSSACCAIEKAGEDMGHLFVGDAVTVREFLAAVQQEINSINSNT